MLVFFWHCQGKQEVLKMSKKFYFEKLNKAHGWLYFEGKRMLLSCENAKKLRTETDVRNVWDEKWVDTEYK
jgi:uncharacterized C2H2 Zn-finger protein